MIDLASIQERSSVKLTVYDYDRIIPFLRGFSHFSLRNSPELRGVSEISEDLSVFVNRINNKKSTLISLPQ